MTSRLPLAAAPVVAAGLLAASLGLAPGSAEAGVVPAPNVMPVDPSQAVLFPVEDVVGGTEKLIFAQASADGAVTDRGGREFILASDLLFAFNQATLTARARQEIARIADVLRSSTTAEAGAKVTSVTITGYTDDAGSNAYNLGLSSRRARAVRGALDAALGSTVAVTATGRGERDPVATNDTKRGRQANRRVEIRAR